MSERIVSHPSTQEYRDNYDRIFRKECQQDAHSEPTRNDQPQGETMQAGGGSNL